MAKEKENDQEEEPVELNEDDMAVIDDINNESDEDTDEDGFADDDSGEVDAGEDDDSPSGDDEPDGEISPDMVQMAANYGLNAGDFADEAALARTLGTFNAYGQQWNQAWQNQQQPQGEEGEPAPVGYQFGFKEDYFDDDVVEALNNGLNSVAGDTQRQIEQLAAYVFQHQQAFQGQSDAAFAENEITEFDSAVSSLSRKGTFGDGGYRDHEQTTKFAKNRERLYDKAVFMADGYRSKGLPVPDVTELVRQADKLEFEKDHDKLNRRRANNRIRRQANRRIGGSSGEKSSNASAKDPVDSPALKEAWDGFMQENGDT